jgi:dihydrofolate synthase / folylpolyglutamate synthase
MFSRLGASAIKKDLTNTVAFCEYLGNPQHHFKGIHIAGTNGKGSVSSYLASILQEAGYTVGLYTSPHLVDFGERIKVNGKHISKNYVPQFVQTNKAFIEKLQPSFFEATVAMAFDYFAHKKVDIAIIETGLGGRLDSTNIITPILSVITNIGFDHMDLLGDTLPKIAAEKAGIIKPGIPVVIGEYHKDTLPVFKTKAKETKSNVIPAFKKGKAAIVHEKIGKLKVAIVHNEVKTFIETPLSGKYQALNMNTAYIAIKTIENHFTKINATAIKAGFKNVITNTGLFGRFQIINKNPFVIADVAHNAHGIAQLMNQIRAYEKKTSKIALVIGFVKDKDINTCLQLIPKQYTIFITQANIPRAMPIQQLQTLCNNVGLTVHTTINVNNALKLAKKAVGSKGMVVVCGSIFMVGEIKGITKHKPI